jgi:hypothetical protein
MKKTILFLFIALISINGYSQKKKKASTKKASTTALAKIDNLIAEVKNNNFQITIDGKDALIVKALSGSFTPINTKLTSFMASGTKLYLLQWTEKNNTKTDLKTEDITSTYSVIYEIPNKKQVFSNFQTTNNITEKVFLDRLKTASETQQRVRKEGFEFTLNSDGSVTQTSKNQLNKWVYDATKMEYVDAKKKK